MNEEDIIHLSQLCNDIVETGTYDKEFPVLLYKYSNFLLSKDSNQLEPNPDFQGLLMVMYKLAIVSYDVLPNSVFHQLFRSIIAFNIHFFISSKENYSKFLSEWPISFAKNYVFSILTNFFPKNEQNNIISEFAISTLLMVIYFSNDPSANPVSKIFQEHLSVDIYSPIFDTIQTKIPSSPLSVILFYTLITQCSNFKSYCLSCVDTSWIFSLIEPIIFNSNSNSIELSEIRLNTLFIFTEDNEFSKSISKDQKGTVLRIINDMISIIKYFINIQKTKSIIIMTSLSIMFNVGKKVSGIDAKTSDSIFSLLLFLFKYRNDSNHFTEFIQLLISFVEAVCVHRMRNNIELIYAVIRQFDIIEKIQSIQNLNEMAKCSLKNLLKIKQFLYENVISKNLNVFDYNKMLALVTASIDSWNTDGVFKIVPFPSFTYLSNELTSSLKFFRVLILKEIPSIL